MTCWWWSGWQSYERILPWGEGLPIFWGVHHKRCGGRFLAPDLLSPSLHRSVGGRQRRVLHEAYARRSLTRQTAFWRCSRRDRCQMSNHSEIDEDDEG